MAPLWLRTLALRRAAPSLADDYRLTWAAVLVRLPRVAHLPVDALAAHLLTLAHIAVGLSLPQSVRQPLRGYAVGLSDSRSPLSTATGLRLHRPRVLRGLRAAHSPRRLGTALAVYGSGRDTSHAKIFSFSFIVP